MIIEHFIVTVRWAVEQISDTPTWVQEQAALNNKIASEVHTPRTTTTQVTAPFHSPSPRAAPPTHTQVHHAMEAAKEANVDHAHSDAAVSVHMSHAIPRGDTDLDKARANVRLKLAPVFGIPPSVLLPLVLGPLIVTSFKLMPLGIHELWMAVPIMLCIGGYSIKKQRLDSEAAIGIVSDPEMLQAIRMEMPAWFSDPNVDRVRWINQILDTMWPTLDQVGGGLGGREDRGGM